MKARTQPAETTSDGRLVRAAHAWDRFWFAPSDPTTLAVIRILCGVLTLYVHLAYSYDLWEFFGRDAWHDLDHANQERRQLPRLAPPSGWTPDFSGYFLPPDAEARSRVIDYFRRVADDPDPGVRERVAQLLTQPRPADPSAWGSHFPPAYMFNVTDSTREQMAKFLRELPRDRAEREYILGYMDSSGIDPRQASHTRAYYWSIWYHVVDPDWMVLVHCLILVVILMFTLGLFTRVTSVLTWLSVVSYAQRSSVTLFGGDVMMNILLIYLMIGPSGAALSLDRLIARWWAERQARRAGLPPPTWGRPQPMVSATFAQRLIQIHFCIIYFAAGTSKLLGGYWWNGQAIYYTMANYEFAPLHRAYYLEMMRFLAQHRWLWEVVMEGGSYFTLFLELSLPFLVWNRRLRPYYVAGAFALHTAIALLMGLVTFSLLMGTMVLGFVSGETMRRILGWRQGAPPEVEVGSAAKEEEVEETRPTKKGTGASSHVMAKKDI
jgi:hypothetical protein